MLVRFTTTYAISAFHHWCCKFEPRSGRGVQHYGIKFVSDLRQIDVFLWVLLFPPPIKLTARIRFYDFEGYWVYHYHFQQFSSYIMTTRLVRYQKAWTVIMNWPVKPQACGRCLKPWHVRWVLGLKLASEVLFLWSEAIVLTTRPPRPFFNFYNASASSRRINNIFFHKSSLYYGVR